MISEHLEAAVENKGLGSPAHLPSARLRDTCDRELIKEACVHVSHVYPQKRRVRAVLDHEGIPELSCDQKRRRSSSSAG